MRYEPQSRYSICMYVLYMGHWNQANDRGGRTRRRLARRRLSTGFACSFVHLGCVQSVHTTVLLVELPQAE